MKKLFLGKRLAIQGNFITRWKKYSALWGTTGMNLFPKRFSKTNSFEKKSGVVGLAFNEPGYKQDK